MSISTSWHKTHSIKLLWLRDFRTWQGWIDWNLNLHRLEVHSINHFGKYSFPFEINSSCLHGGKGPKPLLHSSKHSVRPKPTHPITYHMGYRFCPPFKRNKSKHWLIVCLSKCLKLRITILIVHQTVIFGHPISFSFVSDCKCEWPQKKTDWRNQIQSSVDIQPLYMTVRSNCTFSKADAIPYWSLLQNPYSAAIYIMSLTSSHLGTMFWTKNDGCTHCMMKCIGSLGIFLFKILRVMLLQVCHQIHSWCDAQYFD